MHDRQNGQAHVINASAARVWELCEGRSFDELVAAFGTTYGREPETVREDVRRVLARFAELGLFD